MTIFLAQLYQAFFSGVRLSVHREQHIKIRFEKRGGSVNDTHTVFSCARFFDLQGIRRHSGIQKIDISFNDIIAQLIGIRNIESLFCFFQSAVFVTYYPTVQKIMPHTGGISVMRLKLFRNVGNTFTK